MLVRVLDPRHKVREEIILREAEKAVREKVSSYLLVPEQATAEYETILARRCGAPGQRYLEVTNFSRLRDVVLRQVGGVAQKTLGQEEKEILLALTLSDRPEEAALLCRRNDAAAVAELANDLEEARLSGLGEREMLSLSEKAEVGEKLAAKLYAASLILTDWRRRAAALADVCPDPDRQLLDALTKQPFFQGSRVFVHDFRDFTAPQERILRAILRQASSLWVTLPCERKENELYHKAYLAARRLKRMADENTADPAVRDEPTPAENETGELAFLRKSLLDHGAKWEKAPEKISVTACADGVEEAAFVADRILQAVVSGGCRWNEIAVLSRSGETERILSQVFSEAKIPHYLEKKRSLSETPAAHLILLAAKIALGLAFRGEEREYLQNPYVLLPEEERFLLEKYLVTWRLTPAVLLRSGVFTKNPEGYGEMNDRSRRELMQVNDARRKVVEPLQKLALALAAGTTAEKISSLVDFMRRVGAEEVVRAEQKAAFDRGAFDDAAEIVRDWNCALSRLGSLAEIAGEETAAGREFYFLLEIALSGDAPGEVPPAQDAVLVGTVDLARPAGISKLFLTGMNAGVFPRGETPGRLFTGEERTLLGSLDFALSHPDLRRKEEAFFFSLAAGIPRDELILSYRTRGDMERDKGAESIFVKRCCALFPALRVETFRPEEASPKTHEAAFRALTAHLSDPGIEKTTYFQYFAARPETAPALLSAAAGAAADFSGGGELTREKPYVGKRVRMSYSGIEEYTKCPFKFYANRLLKAKEDPKGELWAAPVGSLIHEFLEAFLLELASDGVSPGSLSPEETESRATRLFREKIKAWFGEAPEASFRRQLDLVLRDAMAMLLDLVAEFSRSGFRPVLFEQRLEELPEGYRIPLPDGRELYLIGSIDRVDHYRSAKGEDYVRVVDYKTGSHAFSLKDVANGLDLQMLLYLFALWGKPVPLKDGVICPEPAGILYVNGRADEKLFRTSGDVERCDPNRALKAREGLLVDDPELICAQDPDKKGILIPVKYKDGAPKENQSTLISLVKLGRLRRRVERDLTVLAQDLCRGRIPAERLYQSEKDDPCRWCGYLPLCKRKEAARRPLRKMTDLAEEMEREEEKV